jgi:hypothetical protein
MMNTGENISYEEEFDELRCIGRGNFGAAFVVRLKNAPDGEEIYFIAKKIILNQLTDKEQEGAHLEVSFICLFQLYFRLSFCGNSITLTSCLTSTPS